MKRKRCTDVLALLIFLVANSAFVGGVLWPIYHSTHNQKRDAGSGGASNIARKQEPPESFWERTTTDPVAAFTGVLAVFTGVLSVVSFIQIAYLIRADRSASAAAKAAQASAEALPDLERAYVFVEVKLGIPNVISRDPTSEDGGFICPIVVRATNHGRTPAILTAVRIWQGIYERVPFSLPDFIGQFGSMPEGSVIGAGRFYSETEERKVTVAEWEGVTTLETMIVCCGIVEYRDVLRREQETGFCWQLDYQVAGSRFIMSKHTPLNYTKQKGRRQ